MADDAGLGRHVEAHVSAGADHQLGRAAADVDDERGRRVPGSALARRAAEGQPRLLSAGDDPRVEPVARRAHAREEVLAVGRVAHGAGEHGDGPLGSLPFDDRLVLGERGEHARHGVVAQQAGLAEPVAEARDLRAALALGQRAVGGDVGDEQPRRVGADVDDGDSHLRKVAARRRASACRRAQRGGCRRRGRPWRPGPWSWPSRCGGRRAGWASRRAGGLVAAARGR